MTAAAAGHGETPVQDMDWLRPYTMAEMERIDPPQFDHIQQWHFDWLRSVTPVVPPGIPLCLMNRIP